MTAAVATAALPPNSSSGGSSVVSSVHFNIPDDYSDGNRRSDDELVSAISSLPYEAPSDRSHDSGGYCGRRVAQGAGGGSDGGSDSGSEDADECSSGSSYGDYEEDEPSV